MKWHISFEHLYFKSKREEWSVRVWREVKYRPPPKRAKPFEGQQGTTTLEEMKQEEVKE